MAGRLRISQKKRSRLESLSTGEGIIAALAIDQRKSLRRMIAAARSTPANAVSDEQLCEFKAVVARKLTRDVSAVLLDPEYGLGASQLRSPGCGLLLTYEADGYENPRAHKMLALLPRYSVRRLAARGADAIKILLSYSPDEDEAANDEKKALIERIGSECYALDIPFFLEPVVYDPKGSDTTSCDYARRKPEWVVATIEEFSKEIYGVDVLKVEFPATARFTEGSSVYSGETAYLMDTALNWFRAADAAARKPYIYLSAGVSSAEFVESLRLAAAAGARFSGVLCGRANWQGGVSEYAAGGEPALAAWLETEGARNISAVNEALRSATPWHAWLAESQERQHVQA